jgi:tetratricopeptide (TPR) repeat protein
MELKKALKIEPENAVTHLNLSMAYRQQENYPQAMSHVVSAIKHNPLMSANHLQLARLHLLNDQLGEAAVALDEAFRLGVEDPQEQLQYAHVLLRVGRYAEAEQQAQLVTFADPQNPMSWAVLAETLDAQGRRQDAMASLDKGLLIAPNNQALQGIQRRFRQNPR